MMKNDLIALIFKTLKLKAMIYDLAFTSGPLKGKRVVRGLEVECQAYYESLKLMLSK